MEDDPGEIDPLDLPPHGRESFRGGPGAVVYGNGGVHWDAVNALGDPRMLAVEVINDQWVGRSPGLTTKHRACVLGNGSLVFLAMAV